MMEAIPSSETSILAKVTWRHIPKDGILHSHAVKTLNLTYKTSFAVITYLIVTAYFSHHSYTTFHLN
jgi:hypothetical protein